MVTGQKGKGERNQNRVHFSTLSVADYLGYFIK
jgi:hypothetical protein